MKREMSRNVEICVPVPQECMGIVIGTGGRNIKQLKQETRTRITSCNGDNLGKQSGFTVTGTATGCEKVRLAIRRRIENHDDVRKIDVPKEYINVVVGKEHKNIEKVETKTETKIIVPSRRNSEAQDGDAIQLRIIGLPKNCDRAESRIRDCIAFHQEKRKRNEFGGDTHFVCFDFKDENDRFSLKSGGCGFTQGQRYRIETEIDDDNCQSEVRITNNKIISEMKDHLLAPLQNLNKSKENEKELMVDLWCHFGKAFVSNVDEEEAKNIMTPVDINTRLIKIVSEATLQNKDKDAYWKVSFEEGVNPLDVNDGALPKFEDDNHGWFFDLKLVQQQWRYDFTFLTPSKRSVRLKAWEGLPPSRDEPPVEVKNILRQVSLHADKGIKAWICYPSTSVLRGEILTPNSQYDCRIKLRAGFRNVTDKDSVCKDEEAILCDYLSNCKFDKASHRMNLPDPKDHEIPEGYECTYYREANERMFQATVDEECFTVIVLNEKGWDTDSSDENQEQFGIRVVMNSWSEALLSPERHWTPQEILDKLEDYMEFLSLLKNYFFDDQ